MQHKSKRNSALYFKTNETQQWLHLFVVISDKWVSIRKNKYLLKGIGNEYRNLEDSQLFPQIKLPLIKIHRYKDSIPFKANNNTDFSEGPGTSTRQARWATNSSQRKSASSSPCPRRSSRDYTEFSNAFEHDWHACAKVAALACTIDCKSNFYLNYHFNRFGILLCN